MFQPPRYILAPYVPTPPEVVEAMLRLGNVQASDRVYDLGCGDGRLVIGAAKACGASGIGVDIEPYWIEQSQENAALAGVSSLVHFECRDALTVDLSEASVVFLYLVHWSTQFIVSHIRRQLRPGTRVVSHSFPIESLSPTVVESVQLASGETHNIFLWLATDEPA